MPEEHFLNPEQWIANFSKMLYGYAYIRVNDEEFAKDLVQDTYFAALNSKDKFRGEVSEKNWLFMILKNKIIDYYRKKSASIVSEAKESENEFFDENGNWLENQKPNDWQQDPDALLESEEFKLIIEKCKNKLPQLHSAVFTLKYLLDEDTEKICKDLNISESNYWVAVHRARLKLRKCLEKLWIEC